MMYSTANMQHRACTFKLACNNVSANSMGAAFILLASIHPARSTVNNLTSETDSIPF